MLKTGRRWRCTTTGLIILDATPFCFHVVHKLDCTEKWGERSRVVARTRKSIFMCGLLNRPARKNNPIFACGPSNLPAQKNSLPSHPIKKNFDFLLSPWAPFSPLSLSPLSSHFPLLSFSSLSLSLTFFFSPHGRRHHLLLPAALNGGPDGGRRERRARGGGGWERHARCSGLTMGRRGEAAVGGQGPLPTTTRRPGASCTRRRRADVGHCRRRR